MNLQDALHELFLVDQQLRGLESRLDSARMHTRAQQIRIEQLNAQHNELTTQLKQTQAAAHNAENEVASAEQRIESLRQKMNTAKTNKEYSALLVEVNTIKADKGKLEESALELMTRVDALKLEVAAVETKQAEQAKVKALADKEQSDRQAEVGDRLEELKTERAAAAEKVPPRALAEFEKLNDQFDGDGMCPVIEEDRRRMEYSCGGCYMSIPVELVNRLATQEDVVICPSCSRMLFLEKELRASMGVKS